MRPIVLAVFATTVSLAGCAATPLPPPPVAVVRPAPADSAAAFLDAFNALDPARFDAFFAEDVTMFFPEGPFPKARVEGKAAVTQAFHRFFAMARERGAKRLNIVPQKLAVQDLGDVAIVSFELGGSGNIGRRSLVFRLDGGAWRIVHFHASAVEAAKP